MQRPNPDVSPVPMGAGCRHRCRGLRRSWLDEADCAAFATRGEEELVTDLLGEDGAVGSVDGAVDVGGRAAAVSCGYSGG